MSDRPPFLDVSSLNSAAPPRGAALLFCLLREARGAPLSHASRQAVNRTVPDDAALLAPLAGDVTRHDRLLRTADRLRRLHAGSATADAFIHEVLGLAGPVLPCTRDEAAARLLVPPGFEADWPTTIGRAVYGTVQRSGIGPDGLPHPHHGQRGATLCGAAMRARAWLTMAPT